MARLVFAVFFSLLTITAGIAPAHAVKLETGQDIVWDAVRTVEKMRTHSAKNHINFLLERAKAVIIFPHLLKAGLFFGGEGGSGVMLSRDAEGRWSYPAFYKAVSGSFGLQAGVQESRAMLIIMSDKALKGALQSGFELGADASVAAGSTGADGEWSTTTIFQDIYFFSETDSGVYAGISLEGTVLSVRKKLNKLYYGKPVTTREILIDRTVSNSQAMPLIEALSRSDLGK
jgi:lipid-binding SYLF domain-containing protein